MALSFFSSTKFASAFIANEISSLLTTRGYAAAAQGGLSSAARSGASSSVMFQRGPQEPVVKVPWVPDPVTGYYRRENQAREIDPAELRAVLVNNRDHKFQD